MRCRFFQSIIVFLAVIVFASPVSAVWYMDSEFITADVSVTSGLDIDYGPRSALDYVEANVSFVPKERADQSVIRVSAEPDYSEAGDEFLFRWDRPAASSLKYTIDMRVRTKNTFLPVKKSGFPYLNMPDSVKAYTLPTKTVDSDDPVVIDKASELAAGESDYYTVVFKMADWTRNNIEYDLSTLNVKASNRASEVIRSRNGVCDEMTTLFMALLRAVGIPAKFVTGVAYTESPKFPQKWGAHGWAEVYFPGTGWVPFDVTYGQYGFVDPTHITMKEADDAADPDTKYEWLGRDIEISAKPILVSADVVKKEGFVPGRFSVSVDVIQDTVAPGSYNIIAADVTNLADSYASTLLYLSKVAELDSPDGREKAVMLKPHGRQTVYWLVKVTDDLPSGYTYTFPVAVSDIHNASGSADFHVIPGATVFSRSEMQSVIDAAEKEEQNIYSKKIGIECFQEQEYYYVYDEPKVSCIAQNTGNFPFRKLDFCFGEDDCAEADLAIAQEKMFSHVISSPEEGVNKLKFSVEGKDVSRSHFYDLEILDEPEVSIDDIEYPSQIEFDKPYQVGFTLKRKSSSEPQDVVIHLDAAGLEKEIEVPEMQGDKKMVFNMDSGDLSVRPNRFVISVIYEDLNGKTYTAKEEFEIELINVTLGQRIIIWLQDLDTTIRGWFK
ncbi:transglutaminase-like domain-containing protein [Candidatus Woesearchaeota archaeon]|nr:transglutaminase-like domain-containing protein [Candidatus Woesearchaeota archaeon]